MIIGVLNQKGGVGKSTIATNLAVEFAKHYKRKQIMLIDADKQATSSDFMYARALRKNVISFKFEQIIQPILDTNLPVPGIHHTIIDVGGHDNAVFRSAILASDVILIPTAPSAADIWSTEDTLQMIKQVRVPKQKIMLCINHSIPRTKVTAEAIDAAKELEKEFNITFLKTIMHIRVIYRETLKQGIGVTEQSKNNKAADEIRSLFKEVFNG